MARAKGIIMPFRVRGISPEPFRPLFNLTDAELHRIGARRIFADDPAMPCRVSMAHANIGEELLLVNYEHQPANTPYRSNHAIYVRKIATDMYDAVDVIPAVLATRLLAVRAFDADHMMIDADVCEGARAAALFEQFLANPAASYLQVHNARRGCYAARVERA
jgi:hypothetical protein